MKARKPPTAAGVARQHSMLSTQIPAIFAIGPLCTPGGGAKSTRGSTELCNHLAVDAL